MQTEFERPSAKACSGFQTRLGCKPSDNYGLKCDRSSPITLLVEEVGSESDREGELLRIFEAEGFRLFVIGEQLGITAP